MRIKGWIPVLVIVSMLALAAVALARGTPNEQVSAQAIVSVDAPTVANVPPMTVGFDVIQNLSTPTYQRLVSANDSTDTSAHVRQSTTGDERVSVSGSHSARTGPQPRLVLLA